jgi:hypothetical protein
MYCLVLVQIFCKTYRSQQPLTTTTTTTTQTMILTRLRRARPRRWCVSLPAFRTSDSVWKLHCWLCTPELQRQSRDQVAYLTGVRRKRLGQEHTIRKLAFMSGTTPQMYSITTQSRSVYRTFGICTGICTGCRLGPPKFASHTNHTSIDIMGVLSTGYVSI